MRKSIMVLFKKWLTILIYSSSLIAGISSLKATDHDEEESPHNLQGRLPYPPLILPSLENLSKKFQHEKKSRESKTEKDSHNTKEVNLTSPIYGHYSMEHRTPEASDLKSEKKFFHNSLEPVERVITSEGGIIQSGGIKITIPKDAVREVTTFRLKRAPDTMAVLEHVMPLTALYEVEPHNLGFNALIKLEFQFLEKMTPPIALFIQKDNSQDKLLKKWFAIDPYEVENNTAVFLLKSFSFLFVGQMDIQKLYNLPNKLLNQNKFDEHNIIRPGLNYRAQCEDNNCPMNKLPMIIHRGFGEFSANQEIDDGKIECLTCHQPLTEYDNIKQLIMFQTTGDINYRVDARPRPKPKKVDFSASNDKIIIYGEIGETEKYTSFKVTARPQPLTSINIAMVEFDQYGNVEFDQHGNPKGAIYDLGVDGAYKNIKLLIGKFYNGEEFTHGSFDSHVGAALREKGFNWVCTEDESEFLSKLPDYNVAWVIGFYSSDIKNKDFVEKVVSFHKSGNGLMLWEDNDSIPGKHTTAILQALFGMTVQGNDPGQNIMEAAADYFKPLTFSKLHPILRGIRKLYEGYTICYPDIIPPPAPIKVLATSSAGRPNIMYVNEKRSVDGDILSGRVVIDCAFTKLFGEYWDTAGTARYVKNATCWLSGLSYDDEM